MEDPKGDENSRQTTNFAKYSGIAFQMLAVIGVFSFVGYQLDKHRNAEKPIFTALLGLLGVIISLYQVVRSLRK